MKREIPDSGMTKGLPRNSSTIPMPPVIPPRIGIAEAFIPGRGILRGEVAEKALIEWITTPKTRKERGVNPQKAWDRYCRDRWHDRPRAQGLDPDHIRRIRSGFMAGFRAGTAANQADGWISVKDRYPENGQEVLFIVEAGDEDYAGSIQKGHYHRYQFSDGEIDHEFSFPSRGTRASFWMPCPEPPYVPAEGKESV